MKNNVVANHTLTLITNLGKKGAINKNTSAYRRSVKILEDAGGRVLKNVDQNRIVISNELVVKALKPLTKLNKIGNDFLKGLIADVRRDHTETTSTSELVSQQPISTGSSSSEW